MMSKNFYGGKDHMNNIPRPEHPNPQFQRREWINLNGKWSFKIDKSKSGLAKKYYEPQTKFDRTINVPFCPESVLSGIEYKDFMDAVWYSREFVVPDKYADLKTILHFGAVDYKATVFVNGKEVGTHKGGYISFEFDITDYLNGSTNVLTVYAEDDTRSPLQPRGKQSEEYYSHGCDYTRTTGIWQTVWLEFVPESRIKSIKVFPNVENCSVDIQAEVIGAGKFEALALYQDRIMGAASVETDGGHISAHLDLKEAYLWEVGEGRLYDLELRFNEDKVDSYFGLRDVKLDGQKFLINGKSVFQRLVLDQGFYPDGIYTAPTEEAMIKDIQISLDVGFNGARLHEKIFEPRFLYHCDKMGYIVWGEYPNWGLDHSNPNIVYSVIPEWIEEIERDFNHPAIIGWCPLNETWDYDGRKQFDDALALIYKTTKALDKTRPCIDTSGNYHVITDIFDIHEYEQDPKVFKEHFDLLMTEGKLFDNHEHRQKYTGGPTFISEYGGIRWSVNENEQNAWGYGNAPKSKYEFIERYKGLTNALLDNDQMFGFCYTQLYDVEQEQNGLYTYSRKPKFEASIFRAINSRKAKIEL